MRMAHFTAAIHMAEKSALRTSGPWFNCCQQTKPRFQLRLDPVLQFRLVGRRSGNCTTTDFEEHSSFSACPRTLSRR